ncbi:MAG: sensor histidine kinase [Burkholderiales bacterium]
MDQNSRMIREWRAAQDRWLPALNLKSKLILLMVVLLGLTLGAEVWVSLGTQDAIVRTTQQKVKDLASVIQISVQQLTSVTNMNRGQLQEFVAKLPNKGLEVSIASSQNLIINSSNPKLIGAALVPPTDDSIVTRQVLLPEEDGKRGALVPLHETTEYLIPVKVEDHLLGYVRVVANFAEFAQPLQQYRMHQITVAFVIFAFGLGFAYLLADRYVEPIHEVAAAAQNIAARGLEPVPEANRRDEIGLLTRSFNEMVSQLRRAREREHELNRLERFTALGQLAGGLAHEIKNPLNFISLALDQLRTRYSGQLTQDRAGFQHQLIIMKDEVRRLSELIQSFLHYGKPIEIHPAPTDLRQLIDGVLAISDSKLKVQGIELHQPSNGQPPLLNVDAEKLRTCFVNVVANAIQAMPDGGKLSIGIEQNNEYLEVSFSDTGPGIDPEIATHVFEPFFTTKREGIGLGLFLSKAIVETHGGTVTIGNRENEPGTTVTFSFPLNGPYRQI